MGTRTSGSAGGPRKRSGRKAATAPRAHPTTSAVSPAARPTRSAVMSATPTSAPTPRRAAGSRAPAGRCSRRPNARPSASSPPSARSNRPTPGSTAPSCCAQSSGCSTTSTTDALARAHLDAWLAWAARSRLAPFVALARTLRRHRDGILAAIRPGLSSNGRLEGHNSKTRLISHRSFGFHSAAALIALVYLCCAGVVIDLPR